MLKRVILAVAIMGLPAAALAQDLPDISSIPAAFAAPYGQQRASIEGNLKTLTAAVENHNAKCALVTKGTALDRECAGEQTTLEGDVAAYIARVEAFNRSIAQFVETKRSEYCAARRILDADGDAIHNRIGAEVNNERLEELAELSREQEAEARHKVFDLLIETAFEKSGPILPAGVGAEEATPAELEKLISKLRKQGVVDPRQIDEIRHFAQSKEHYERGRQILKSMKQAADTKAAIDKDASNASLQAILGILKILQRDPTFGVAVTTTEFAITAGWLYFLTKDITALNDANAEKLKLLPALFERVKTHASTLKTRHDAWRTATGKADRPDCKTYRKP